RAYCEDLPATGSAVCRTAGGLYTRKHAPWTEFGNLDHSNERGFADLDADLTAGSLPQLAFVVPNNRHNSHDSWNRVIDADDWLAAYVPRLARSVGPRGLLILTWDEGEPWTRNHILTVFG